MCKNNWSLFLSIFSYLIGLEKYLKEVADSICCTCITGEPAC